MTTAPSGSERPLSAGDWRVDYTPRGGGRTESQWADSEAEAEALATDLVRLHGGRCVAWRWRG